jgi:PAS domain S-box-containing protein
MLGLMTQRSVGAEPGEDYSYRKLVESLNFYAVSMLDTEGKITKWNAGGERLTGFGAADVIGQTCTKFYSAADCAEGVPAATLAAAIRFGKFEAEGWQARKDGTWFWGHVAVLAIRDSSGKFNGYARIVRDLTEKRELEEQLKHTQQQLSFLIQNATERAVIPLDRAGHVNGWNAGAERLTGYSQEDAMGRHLSLFHLPEQREIESAEEALKRAAEDGLFETEGWRARKDGVQFRASVAIYPTKDCAGNISGFAVLMCEHAGKTGEDTAEPVSLFRSPDSELSDRLTGLMAHDFNNLVALVLSSLELLQKRLPNVDQIQSLLRNAAQAANGKSLLTEKMLASDAEAGLESAEEDWSAFTFSAEGEPPASRQLDTLVIEKAMSAVTHNGSPVR